MCLAVFKLHHQLLHNYRRSEHGLLCFSSAVVLENHEVADEGVDPPLKRQRIEINCQDPSIKVVAWGISVAVLMVHNVQLVSGGQGSVLFRTQVS